MLMMKGVQGIIVLIMMSLMMMISLVIAQEVQSSTTSTSAAIVSPQNVEPESFWKCISVALDIGKCAAAFTADIIFIDPFVFDTLKPCCTVLVKTGEECLPKAWLAKGATKNLRKACKLPPKPKYALSSSSINEGVSSAVATGDHHQLLDQCLSSVRSVEGCIEEVVTSFLNLKVVRPIGPSCCKAILEINDGCWRNIFPFNPFFPPLLRNFCLHDQLVHLAPASSI